MRLRPWPIVLLACFQAVLPILLLLGTARFYDMTLMEYLRVLVNLNGPMSVLMTLAAYWIAGAAIYGMKPWSYLVFMGAIGFSLIDNYQNWALHPEAFPAGVLLVTYFLDIALVSYFLLSSVRQFYFNPKLRWWESRPRWELNRTGTIMGPWGADSCRVVNVSDGGSLLKCEREFHQGDELTLCFSVLNLHFKLQAKCVHVRPDGFYGIEFKNLSKQERSRVSRLVEALNLLGGVRSNPPVDAKKDFLDWTSNLIKTGKGLVPASSAPAKTKSASNQSRVA